MNERTIANTVRQIILVLVIAMDRWPVFNCLSETDG